jgi:hypothetical protein
MLRIMTPAEVAAFMNAGRQILGAVLEPHGFEYRQGGRGQGSGGNFESAEFVRGDRKVELHFRYSLGQVRYHLGDVSISHEEYMRHTGHRSDAKYPGFSSDPLDGFRHLAADLHAFCGDFISGGGATLREAKKASDASANLCGIARLNSHDL